MKRLLQILLLMAAGLHGTAQTVNCNFKPPVVTIDFGNGLIRDMNSDYLRNYERIGGYCPRDGYYSFANYTSDCFSGDWHTIETDHTPGTDGNMLLVNGAPRAGLFFNTLITGLKPNTRYEFGFWVMNLCRPTEKCPFPLLPNLQIRFVTESGTVIASFATGDIVRVETPKWTQHRAMFTTPASVSSFTLLMADLTPGGCGNDFVIDDITIRECVLTDVVKTPTKPAVTSKPTAKTPVPSNAPQKKQAAPVKSIPKKPAIVVEKKEPKMSEVSGRTIDTSRKTGGVTRQTRTAFPPPPAVLVSRTNLLAKRIETSAGEIKIDLYDNGTIDGDTVSIFHNNRLIKRRQRLSASPISITITVDENEPHHELIMVAENLGSIPPNTSVMIVTAGGIRHEVFISSTETKNAKVVVELKR